MKLFRLAILIAFVLFAFSNLLADNIEKEMVEERFTQYLQHMIAGEYDRATAFWNNDYLYDVYKFGIAYENAPYKFDCRSPLINYLDSIREGRKKLDFKIVPKAVNIYSAYVEIEDVKLVDQEAVNYQYWMIQGEDKLFYLAPRYWAPISTLQIYEGDYYRLYYSKDTQINDSALARVDREIMQMAGLLDIDSASMQRLAADKLNYFLCENFNQVKEYADVTSQPGIHDPAGDYLITSYFPHQKIIADFLITFKLRNLPLYTQPFIRTGLAVYLGGRAGMNLSSFAQMAHFSYQSDFVDFNDILTYEGFHQRSGGPDFSYTLSGYFVGYLLEHSDMDKMLELYLALGGSKAEVEEMNLEQVKESVEKTMDMKWGDIEKGFENYLRKHVDDMIAPVENIAATRKVYQSGTGKITVIIYADDEWYYLDAESLDRNSPARAALLFGPKVRLIKDYESTLFPKHFPDLSYQGQYYGIIFDEAEIGTYNYLTNEISSKYIMSLAGNGSSGESWRARFRVNKELIPADFDNLEIKIIDPTIPNP